MSANPISNAPAWQTQRGKAPGLTDLAGDMRLTVEGKPVGVLHVDHGQVFVDPDGDASSQLLVDSQDTLLGVLSGHEHPFVAYLQGRLQIEGDRALALRILFGLRGGSPWNGIIKSEAA